MWILSGLGNPGATYRDTRHNIGFMVIVQALRRWGGQSMPAKFQSELGKCVVGAERVILQCPMTFMNRSGFAVVPAMKFYQVPPAQLVVIHDELDLPFGTVRLKQGGGLAGHNGLRSIAAQPGEPSFLRLRVGIGRPAQTGRGADYVLQAFSASERAELPDVLDASTDALEKVLLDGIEKAMNAVNQRLQT